MAFLRNPNPNPKVSFRWLPYFYALFPDICLSYLYFMYKERIIYAHAHPNTHMCFIFYFCLLSVFLIYFFSLSHTLALTLTHTNSYLKKKTATSIHTSSIPFFTRIHMGAAYTYVYNLFRFVFPLPFLVEIKTMERGRFLLLEEYSCSLKEKPKAEMKAI